MMARITILATLVLATGHLYADTSPGSRIEPLSPCEYTDNNKLPTVAALCSMFNMSHVMILGCEGEPCITGPVARRSREHCQKRKDFSPNVNPKGLTFTMPPQFDLSDLTHSDVSIKSLKKKNRFIEEREKLLKSLGASATNMRDMFPKKKTFVPVPVPIELAEFFLNVLGRKNIKDQKDYKGDALINHIVFIGKTKGLDEANIYSVEEDAFKDIDKLSVRVCD